MYFNVLIFSNILTEGNLQDKLALNITLEQGKTLKDAQGDVFRGLGLCCLLLGVDFADYYGFISMVIMEFCEF